MIETVQISHDPFAREAITREIVRTTETCDWCGRSNEKGRLFRYYVEPDRIVCRQHEIQGLFCSVECMRIYYS